MLIAFALAAGSVAASPAQAVSPDPCPMIARLVAAASERPAFASVRRALARGEAIVPGFAAGDCRVDAATGFGCSLWSMGSHGFPDWQEPVTCPGLRAVALPRTRLRQARRLLAPGGIRIEYGLRCGGCAGNATSWFSVRREGQGRAEE